MIKLVLGAAAMAVAVPALAAPAVDGTRDASYKQTATVTYDPNAPSGNFGAPGTTNNGAAYQIYLTSDASNVFGFIQADRAAPQFSNLYFDLDPANGNGSDLAFEITNRRAFVPGMDGYSGTLAGLTYAFDPAGTALEFSIANSLFTGPISGLTYYPGQEFPANGDKVVLRLSQTFGYSVAGGPSYGANRLGAVTIGGTTAAVPEPATWAMLIMGFGLVGWAMRRRTGVAVKGVRFA